MPLSEEQAALLRIIFNAKPELRNAMLKNADKELVRTICECVLNIINGNVNVDDINKKKLAKHKCLLRKIVKKTKAGRKREQLFRKVATSLSLYSYPSLVASFQKYCE